MDKLKSYKILIELEQGVITTEEAQTELLLLLQESGNRGKTYRGKELLTMPVGFYVINWDKGGFNKASIGKFPDGSMWLAPIEWVFGDKKIRELANYIDDIDYVELLFTK